MRYSSLLCLLLLLTMMGCSSVPQKPSLAPRPITTSAGVDITEGVAARAALRAQHQEWAGTPYRFGGMSKAGVDCSGFVWKTFAHRFGLDLPRTTEGLVKVGYPVERSQLNAGDLVFFQTGFNKLHVGIYLEAGQFLHASASRGVTISGLSNPYWTSNYWHGRRIR